MFSPTPSRTTDTGKSVSSLAPAMNSGSRGPGTLEMTRFSGGRVRPRRSIVVRAASAATAGGMKLVASVSSEAGSAAWLALALRSSSWARRRRARGGAAVVGVGAIMGESRVPDARVRDVCRDRDDHGRDPVAERGGVLRRADRHGDHRDQRRAGQLVALDQPLAHGGGTERDDDVVDRDAQLALDGLDGVERERAER